QSRPITNKRFARSAPCFWRTRSRRSRTASVTAVVKLSPVSLASCLVSRYASLFLMFILTISTSIPIIYINLPKCQPHCLIGTVLVDEFDAGTLEGLPQNNQRCTSRFSYTSFYLSNSHDTDPGLTSEIVKAADVGRCTWVRSARRLRAAGSGFGL